MVQQQEQQEQQEEEEEQGETEVLYDAEVTEIYARLSGQHAHARGPWAAIVRAVVEEVGPPPGAVILDLASGPGEPARSLAVALPEASVVATDVSPHMVDAARAYENLPNFRAEVRAIIPQKGVLVADFGALPFETASLDVVTCCYGFMFAEDVGAALAEAWRVLKPGGALVATTWEHIDMRDLQTELLGALAHAPPVGLLAADPLKLADAEAFEALLHTAGFGRVRRSRASYPISLGPEPRFQFDSCTMLVRDALIKVDDWPRAHAAFDAIAPKYTVRDAQGNMVLPHTTYGLFVAWKHEQEPSPSSSSSSERPSDLGARQAR